jgi:hypothetical protein
MDRNETKNAQHNSNQVSFLSNRAFAARYPIIFSRAKLPITNRFPVQAPCCSSLYSASRSNVYLSAGFRSKRGGEEEELDKLQPR